MWGWMMNLKDVKARNIKPGDRPIADGRPTVRYYINPRLRAAA